MIDGFGQRSAGYAHLMADEAAARMSRPSLRRYRDRPAGRADAMVTLLDLGLVIDADARMALVGAEVMTVDARVCVMSLDTFVRSGIGRRQRRMRPGSR